MSSRHKEKDHHVFFVIAHGSLKTDLIRIDTSKINYYDFGKEMYILRMSTDFSNFAHNSADNAVKYIKSHRGILSDSEHNVLFENIVDESVSDGYIFDRNLHMFPFVADEDSIKKGELTDDNPYILSTGVYEVNPDILQKICFCPLNEYKDFLSDRSRTDLNNIAKEIYHVWLMNHSRTIQIATIISTITSMFLPYSTPLILGTITMMIYTLFAKEYINSKAYQELTRNSVIPINKEYFTLSEIMTRLRNIPKYKKGIHHIIIISCYGGLTDPQEIEQILKIQQNQTEMNVSVHTSYYNDSKKIYDISSDNEHLSADDPIYNLLEMIKIEKSNIDTDSSTKEITPFFQRLFCLKSSKSSKKCVLEKNKLSLDTIISICSITKLWIDILRLDPTYLDERHRHYIESYNKKYRCSYNITPEEVKKIMDIPRSTPVSFDKDKDFLQIQNLIENYENSPPEYLRKIIESIIVNSLFSGGSLDRSMYQIINGILYSFTLELEIIDNWYEINVLLSKKYDKLSKSELKNVISFIGTDENKETFEILTSPEYIDTEAITFVQNQVDEGMKKTYYYIKRKEDNFNKVIRSIFVSLKYRFDEIPIIYHIPSTDEVDLKESYWTTFSTQDLIKILNRIAHKLDEIDKLDLIKINPRINRLFQYSI
jgi:hypothetical protein